MKEIILNDGGFALNVLIKESKVSVDIHLAGFMIPNIHHSLPFKY